MPVITIDTEHYSQEEINLVPAASYSLLFNAGYDIVPVWDKDLSEISCVEECPLDSIITDVTLLAEIQQIINETDSSSEAIGAGDSLIPVGSIIEYVGIAIPEGWLQCDGSTIQKVNYSILFAVLGVITDTHILPDMPGKMIKC